MNGPSGLAQGEPHAQPISEIRWVAGWDGDAAERASAAEWTFGAADRPLTRVVDRLAETPRDGARVAMIHVARWIAANWWRLLYEPTPGSAALPPAWRMAHDRSEEHTSELQ